MALRTSGWFGSRNDHGDLRVGQGRPEADLRHLCRQQDPATRRYLIGGDVSLLGLARSERFPIRHGADSVCIDRRPGSSPVKVLSIEIGARRPLGVGVSGLVLLASLPEAEAAQIVRRNTRRLHALHVDPAALLERAARTRAQGYAYAPVGVVPGSRAIAVPVRLADGRTVAGLAMATITERLPDERVSGVVKQMQERAALIGAQAAEIARRKR